MNPKNALVAAVAAMLSGLSCVADRESIQIEYAMAGAIDEACMVSAKDVQLARGRIDIGWTSNYFLALRIKSNLDNSNVTANGQPVAPGSRNDFNISQVSLQYSGKDIPNIPAQLVSRSGTVSAGGELYMGLDLLTADAADRLAAATIPAGGLQVNVQVILRGSFAHGASYETAPYNFPLVLRNSTMPTCGLAQVGLPSDGATIAPCHNWGQDGIYAICGCPSATAGGTSTDPCRGLCPAGKCNADCSCAP